MILHPILAAGAILQICKLTFIVAAFRVVGHRDLAKETDFIQGRQAFIASHEPQHATPTFLPFLPIATASPVSSRPSSRSDLSTRASSTAPFLSPLAIPPSLSPTAWNAPLSFSDLSAFTVTHFAAGKSNLVIVTGTVALTSTVQVDDATPEPTSTPVVGSMLQLLYPEGSRNPANRPQGGADFYAGPLDLSHAFNVTLEYSVYFPEDFDFVLGGKLPGLFGGHESCSGGDSAFNCWSTRMMWREDGKGELYLYAPKDKQTHGLCSLPPESECLSSYGLSIARGSFKYIRGAWTHLAQTVTLNTPGKADGGFYLEVDGSPAIDRRDVYYRDDSSATSSGSSLGDLLSPLLGILDTLDNSSSSLPGDPSASTFVASVSQEQAVYTEGAKKTASRDDGAPIGFTGLFFSTFFGGHDPEWESPRDQYVWFAGFSMRVNA